MNADTAPATAARVHQRDAPRRPRRGLFHLRPAPRRVRGGHVLLHRGGEPPGEWAWKGAAALGLAGQVDPAVLAWLYQQGIGPGGEQLVSRRQPKAAEERDEAAAAASQRPGHHA
jgi:hypothetical protein